MGQLQINQITQSRESDISKGYITNLETWLFLIMLTVKVWCICIIQQ